MKYNVIGIMSGTSLDGLNKLIIPNNITIEFKEALIFAFLGVLRFREENNCLSSVTGAKINNSGGHIFIV